MLGDHPRRGVPRTGNAGEVIEDVEAHRGQYIGQSRVRVLVRLKANQCRGSKKPEKWRTANKKTVTPVT